MADRSPLIIDCQLLQTPTWDRGMGRYCLSLLRAAFAQRAFADRPVWLLYSSNLPVHPERRRQVRALHPGVSELSLPLPASDGRGGTAAQHRAARAVLDTHLKRRGVVRPDFLILSLFTFDYCAVFPSEARKLLIHYDLIPLVMWSMYRRRIPADVYFRRFITLLEADRMLSISRASADDLVTHLGLQRARIHVIDGAHFEHETSTEAHEARRFILMPTADLPHKNNERAVAAFAAFNATLERPMTLLLTSPMSAASRERMEGMCGDVRFAGHVPDAQLAALYRQADLVLVASFKEGLGMPVLEAVAAERKVVCSRIPVFEEISRRAFYYFEPSDTAGIQRALHRAVREDHWAGKHASYRSIAAKYTWERSASLLTDVVNLPDTGRRARGGARWAVVCANPGTGAPSGRIMQFLAAALVERAKLTFYLDAGGARDAAEPSFVDHIAETRDVEDLTMGRFRRYDEVLFAVDETQYTVDVVKRALAMPGRLLLLTPGAGLAVHDEALPKHRRLPDSARRLFERGGTLSLLVNAQRTVVCGDAELAHRAEAVRIAEVPVVREALPAAEPDQRRAFDSGALVARLATTFATAVSDNDALAAYLRTSRWPRQSRIRALVDGSLSHG